MTDHVFVFQEWDVLRAQHDVHEDRIERVAPPPVRNHSYSAQIQEARIRKRLTIADLARLVGVSARTMSLYENGSEMPPSNVAANLARQLELESS